MFFFSLCRGSTLSCSFRTGIEQNTSSKTTISRNTVVTFGCISAETFVFFVSFGWRWGLFSFLWVNVYYVILTPASVVHLQFFRSLFHTDVQQCFWAQLSDFFFFYICLQTPVFCSLSTDLLKFLMVPSYSTQCTKSIYKDTGTKGKCCCLCLYYYYVNPPDVI